MLNELLEAIKAYLQQEPPKLDLNDVTDFFRRVAQICFGLPEPSYIELGAESTLAPLVSHVALTVKK